MILSASRRTDIPAFYTEWFFNRLKEGYIYVRNPMNFHQVSKVMLTPALIDCIVFWTKDPTKMLDKLALLSEYKYYFQITINGYGEKIEKNTPHKNLIIEAFISLSNMIGKEKTIWRYDPIIITSEFDIEWHCNNFNSLASRLGNYTNRCVISFVDLYKKCERNMNNINVNSIDDSTMLEIGSRLSKVAIKYNIKIETCSELVDLSSVGIQHSKCVDDLLISKVIGQTMNVGKDKNQRDICGCVASIDIGAYNTCSHGCSYCYANYSDTTVKNNILKHDPKSPLLIGEIGAEDKITDRKMESYVNNQLDIFSICDK